MRNKFTSIFNSALVASVASMIERQAAEYSGGIQEFFDYLKKGANTGIIHELSDSEDCVTFFEQHKDEINELLNNRGEYIAPSYAVRFIANTPFDKADALCLEAQNQQGLVWFAFMQSAEALAKLENFSYSIR